MEKLKIDIKTKSKQPNDWKRWYQRWHLGKHYSINLTYSEQYSKETVPYKKRKPVIRYGFEDK